MSKKTYIFNQATFRYDVMEAKVNEDGNKKLTKTYVDFYNAKSNIPDAGTRVVREEKKNFFHRFINIVEAIKE
jgi:hypothetical protein